MDDRIVDFNEIKNKARDKDIDKFESYIYSLYYSVAQGQISMADFTKNITEYMQENNISQEKFLNIQKEILKRYGFDLENLEEQVKDLGIEIPKISKDYESIRKNLGFQEKYKSRLTIKTMTEYFINNDLNDLEILLQEENIILKSNKSINLKDVELNEFLCSYKKTLNEKQLKINICENAGTYEY